MTDKKTGITTNCNGFDADKLESHARGTSYWEFCPAAGSEPRPAEEILASSETYICSLIVTVKGPMTVDALRSIKHRVNAESTICLVQNGMVSQSRLPSRSEGCIVNIMLRVRSTS